MSIKCKCGGKTKCIDTRPCKNLTEVRRRYECKLCKKRFSTHEFVVESGIHSMRRKVNIAIDAMNELNKRKDIIVAAIGRKK